MKTDSKSKYYITLHSYLLLPIHSGNAMHLFRVAATNAHQRNADIVSRTLCGSVWCWILRTCIYPQIVCVCIFTHRQHWAQSCTYYNERVCSSVCMCVCICCAECCACFPLCTIAFAKRCGVCINLKYSARAAQRRSLNPPQTSPANQHTHTHIRTSLYNLAMLFAVDVVVVVNATQPHYWLPKKCYRKRLPRSSCAMLCSLHYKHARTATICLLSMCVCVCMCRRVCVHLLQRWANDDDDDDDGCWAVAPLPNSLRMRWVLCVCACVMCWYV